MTTSMFQTASYRIDRTTPRGRLLLTVIAISVIVLLAAMPFLLSPSGLRLLVEVLSYLALAQMWNLLAGYAGLVSVGQQAFVGLGGYLFFWLAIVAGVPVLLAMPLAAACVFVLAIPTAWLAFRLKGAYFAIGTWVIAEVFHILASQVESLGGGSGISLSADLVRTVAESRQMREMVFYWMAFGLAVAATFIVWSLLRSRWGLALTAIRDSEIASESLGVKARQTRFLVYLLVAAFTALVGAFIFLQKLRISPDAAFSVNEWTAFVIFIVVIGGVGSIEGPIIGVAVFFALREALADWGAWSFIIMGLLAIAVMFLDKRGLWGAVAARGIPPIFPTRRILSRS